MQTLLANLLLVAILPASSAAANAETDPLSSVDPADGISQPEAETIASYYFREIAGVGCGALQPPSESRGSWVFETKFGFGGDPSKRLEVSEANGEVRVDGTICVDSFADLREATAEADCAYP